MSSGFEREECRTVDDWCNGISIGMFVENEDTKDRYNAKRTVDAIDSEIFIAVYEPLVSRYFIVLVVLSNFVRAYEL